jgi:hypothetical protein
VPALCLALGAFARHFCIHHSYFRLPPSVALAIHSLHDLRVILDNDLARIYQVPTKVLNQAVKRNRGKFPNDFVFEVSPGEAEDLRRLRSQSVTLKPGRGQDRKSHVKEDAVRYRVKKKPARS